jgi:hypothetical protein
MLRRHGGAGGGERATRQPSRRVPSSSHPASRPTPIALALLWATTDNAPQHLGELHIPALSGASQGDRLHRPRLRSQLCALPHSPFRLVSWSRSLSKLGQKLVDAGFGLWAGAVRCGYRCAAKSASTGCFPLQRPVCCSLAIERANGLATLHAGQTAGSCLSTTPCDCFDTFLTFVLTRIVLLHTFWVALRNHV